MLITVAVAVGLVGSRPAAADVVPADRRTIWNPGIPGGVPGDGDAARPATVWLPSGNPYGGYSVNPALGNGSTDATSAINNAIDSAGNAASASSRRIVFLAPGRYRTNGIVSIDRSNVTLRGSGQGSTIIDHRNTSDTAAIYIGNTVDDFSRTPVVNVLGGASKGASQITVADAGGFNVGDILQIDQLEDGNANGPAGWVWILDSWWSMRSPYANYSGGGGLQGKFPDSPGGYRPISQRIEVLAKSGNTLTIYDPSTGRGSPLHVDFPSSQDPEVWLSAGAGATPVRYSGLESLSVWSAAASGDAKDMVAMAGAAYSWIRDVETDGSRNTWAGRHIHILNSVYRAEVRETYVHNSSNYNQGANAYGILYSGSDCLIEDNIVRELNKPVVGETSGGGNVIAYNYVDEAVIGSLTNSWQETAIDMSHGSFCHSDLFEGNYTPNVGVDSTHGNNGWGVMFRNYVTGRNSSGRTDTYLRAVYVDGWNREMTSVGNVLGGPSFNPTYQVLSPRTGVNPVAGGVSSIYLLGSNAWVLGTGQKPGADYMDDGQAEDLFYRHLDWDKKTGSQYVNPSNPDTNLPNSLYLKSKPAFFGSYPWPWVNPAGSTRVYTLPAKARYEGSLPSAPPFGWFDTPANGATGVAGTIAVTGWALDDVEVTKVQIYRNPISGEPTQPNGKVYVGDAVFVPGARPDVESRYPGYPLASRAGWGYMLLTNAFPPSGGNGTYTLYAYAYDGQGQATLLGSKTIALDNAHAAKPFGTLDTPGQGQTVSGTLTVFGWALTPQPGMIPTDGSTIWLTIDNQYVGHPVYNQYRSDIAGAFPGYANSNGAVGYSVIDTTLLTNGVHTIGWLVTDNLGRAEGLGSRFFWVQN